MRILHFADAHIDIATQGKHDPITGLPVRVLDFLKSLDQIVDTAIAEKVDMVIFAGDAYKDRTPVPTFQREWGKRIIRLSQAGIPTLLLVGNHDISPAVGRANTLHEFETLQVPHVIVASKPALYTPAQLEGLPLQIITLPWVSRSGFLAQMESDAASGKNINKDMENLLDGLIKSFFDKLDPSLPVVLAAHASVSGATYGAERSVMLGNDVLLPGSLVKDPIFSYVALGHIHKAQDVNEGCQPPVVYPGSIERVDFGEIGDDKFFVIASIEKGKPTEVVWHKLNGRKFISRSIRITEQMNMQQQILDTLPDSDDLADAMVRLEIEYPREWESLIDETEIRRYGEKALEFHLIRKPLMDLRLRLPADQTINSMTPLELLETYWKTVDMKSEELEEMKKLAGSLIQQDLPVPTLSGK
jgi:exonuclease SbcD